MTGRPPAEGGGAAARLRRTFALASAALLLLALYGALFTVDVTESGVVTRFGRVVRVVDTPGLHLKLPTDRVRPVDRRLLYSRPAKAEYLTSDKKNVEIRSLAVWRIAEPQRFVETLGTRAAAEIQLADVVVAEIGAALGNYPFASFVSAAEGQSRFEALVLEIRDAVEAYALPAYGIEVVDVEVRQLFLPEANQQSVFERMKAERGKIAKQFRSEGERDASRMIAEAEREKTRIAAMASEEAARLKAEGEAEAMRIYAGAYGSDPSFYRFLRTLQVYETVLDERTTLFLPAEAEVFTILQGDGAGGPGIGPGAPAPGTDDLAAATRRERPLAEAADRDPPAPAEEAVP
jgi:modulator of FtsH protease HflC